MGSEGRRGVMSLALKLEAGCGAQVGGAGFAKLEETRKRAAPERLGGRRPHRRPEFGLCRTRGCGASSTAVLFSAAVFAGRPTQQPGEPERVPPRPPQGSGWAARQRRACSRDQPARCVGRSSLALRAPGREMHVGGTWRWSQIGWLGGRAASSPRFTPCCHQLLWPHRASF